MENLNTILPALPHGAKLAAYVTAVSIPLNSFMLDLFLFRHLRLQRVGKTTLLAKVVPLSYRSGCTWCGQARRPRSCARFKQQRQRRSSGLAAWSFTDRPSPWDGTAMMPSCRWSKLGQLAEAVRSHTAGRLQAFALPQGLAPGAGIFAPDGVEPCVP